ncbi:MAG: hypothetical protein LBJ21_06660 [Acidobacteriota bacterium]|nr:hypothetical protein [Acidobacteriota bacterium]
MDETELEKAKEAAALLGRLGGRIRAETPGEMSRMGRISARKRALSPETLGKMGRKGGAARAAAYSPEQRSEMSRKAYATRREREEAKKQAASPLLVGTEVSAKPE